MKLNLKKNILIISVIIIIILLLFLYNKKELFTDNNNKILEYLKVYNFTKDKKIRLGEKGDGGYIIGDVEHIYDCYISAGISNEESFTKDFKNRYEIDMSNCFAFDGTIEKYPYEYTKDISFIKKNINSFNDDNNTNLHSIINKYNNIFLKMDIEGGEFPWLLSLNIKQLNKFKQIVIELHGINDDSWNSTLNDKTTCLQKLASTHYLIHAHGNNYSPTQNNIPDVIELTYLHKSLFNSKPNLNSIKLPINDLDYVNNKGINDIDLSFYPFYSK